MPIGDPIRLEPGRVLCGTYRIEHWLGGGGYGEVYRAIALDLRRTVAIKVLRPHRGGDGISLARFRREAEIAARLDHPHTVRCLDFATLDDGTPIVVWEFLRGETLAARLQRTGPLPARSVARLAREVLASLDEAHAAGIVHRDVKPSNLMLCEFAGERDFVKVLDFGVAKDLTGQHDDLTGVGEVLGTPRYMAPEQVLGRAVAPATDLYALGLVMAEALTGVAVVAASDKMKAVALQATDDDLELPTAVLEGPLGAVIRRSTRKKLGARFPAATPMREAIDLAVRDLDSERVIDGNATVAVGSPGRGAGPGGDAPANGSARASTGAPVSVPQGGHQAAALASGPSSSGRGRAGLALGGIAALLLLVGGGLILSRGIPVTDSAPSGSSEVAAGLPGAPEHAASALPDDAAWQPINDPVPNGYSRRSFDVVGFLEVATALARDRLPDATLTGMRASGVWRGGQVDTTFTGGGAWYRFRSPAASVPPPGHPSNVAYLASCLVEVYVDDRGLTVTTSYDTCEAPLLPAPRCTPATILAAYWRDLDAGGRALVVTLDYQADDRRGARWRVDAEPFDYKFLGDDCR